MQKIIVVLIIIIAVSFLIRRVRNTFSSGENGCGSCGCGKKGCKD